MDELVWVLHNPIQFLVFMGFIATALAALAWGKTGAVVGFAGAPVWGILSTVYRVFAARPANVPLEFAHLNLGPVFGAMVQGTCVWLLAAVPGTMIGLAIRALTKRDHPKIQKQA
jgi:hypothetical protein